MSGKKRFIKLSDTQRENLEKGFRFDSRATFRQRCHYLLLSDQGYSLNEIAQHFRVSRQLVARWLDRYDRNGIEGLNTRKGQGDKPILHIENQDHVRMVKLLINKHENDLDPVVSGLESRLGRSLSKRTVQRFLKKMDSTSTAIGI